MAKYQFRGERDLAVALDRIRHFTRIYGVPLGKDDFSRNGAVLELRREVPQKALERALQPFKYRTA